MELGGPQSRVLILQWNSKTPAREQVQNITYSQQFPIALFLQCLRWVTFSDVWFATCVFQDCTSSLGTEAVTVNSPILTRFLNTEAILLNISVSKLFCGFSSVPHTRQMMELCKTQKSFLACYKIAEVCVAIALCLILLHPNNKRTYCTK